MTAEKEDPPMENGVDTPEEPNFSDDEDFVDEIDDEELIGDILAKKPRTEEAEESCIIVDGIPKGVGEDKFPKLETILSKVFSKLGPVNSTHYPRDENETTLGYCFVEFQSREIAENTVQVLNNYQLDKNHKFSVNLLTDLDKFTEPPKDWTPPEPTPYKDVGDFHWWLKNPKCQDQFSVQYGGGVEVAIHWNAPHDPDPQPVSHKQGWTETVVQWSPLGSFLASYHTQGVALWAGAMFEQYKRFGHKEVNMAAFSPAEKYLVTYAIPRRKNRWAPTPEAYKIWEIQTGELKRSFPSVKSLNTWPYFKWSHDDKFFSSPFASTQANPKEGDAGGISVYKTEDFFLLDRKSVKIEGLRDFEWSPSDPMVAYWVAEQGQIPSRVGVMRFPSREEVRTKNIFNVWDAGLYWQKSGEHLAIRVERYGKKKKGDTKDGGDGKEVALNVSHQLEIFRVKVKDIPVDIVKLDEPVLSFGWEPSGTKFCALLGSNLRSKAAFYSVQKGEIQHLKDIETQRGAPNQILWAPAGGWVVLANFTGTTGGGQLIFLDASSRDDVTVMNDRAEHLGSSKAEWDPTGRYLASQVSLWDGRSVDLGYKIWNFQGRELCRRNVDRFCRLEWRPRPPSILPDEKIKEVRKNIRQYAERFEKEDVRERGKASKEVVERRRELKDKFKEWRTKAVELWKTEREERLKLRQGEDWDLSLEERAGEMEEETLEFPLTRKEETLQLNVDPDAPAPSTNE
jgi:translation initiation factor 3 subunit B